MSSKVLSTSPEGSVIEFTFRGQHQRTHGSKIKEYIDSVLEKESVSGIVIDFLDYSYEFGNDLFALFMVGYERRSGVIRPVCVVARGLTQASLVSLLKASNAESACDVTFVATTAEVTDWLNRSVWGGSK